MRRRTRWVRPCLESLDGRIVPALFTWDGGGTTDLFSDAANWVGDAAPPADGNHALLFPAVTDPSNLFAINDLAAADGTTKFQSITFRGNYIIDDVDVNENSFLMTEVTQFVSIESQVVTLDTVLVMTATTTTFNLNNNRATVSAMVGDAAIAVGSGDLQIGSSNSLVPQSDFGGLVTGTGTLTLDSQNPIAFDGMLQLGGSGSQLIIGQFGAGEAGSISVNFTNATIAPPVGMATPEIDVLSGFLAFNNTTYPDDFVVGSEGGRWDFGSFSTVGGVESAGITISGGSDVIIDGKAKNKTGSPTTPVSGGGQLRVRGEGEQTFGNIQLSATGAAVTIEGGTVIFADGVGGGFTGSDPTIKMTSGTLGGVGGNFNGDDLRIGATGGVIDPGDTGLPGRLTLATLDAGPGVMVNMQVMGTGVGLFDRIVVDETITMLGGLQVAVPDGVTFSKLSAITVVDTVTAFGSFGGRFSNLVQDARFVDTNTNYGFQIHYNSNAADGNTDVTLQPFDLALPSVALASGQGITVGSEPLDYVVTFSLPVTGFDPADVRVTAPGLGTAVVSITPVNPVGGFAKQFKVQVTGLSGTGPVTIAVPAGGVLDQDQMPNKTSLESTTIAVDTVSPGVTISSSVASPTAASPIPITVTFSESVTDFQLADVLVSNGTAGSFVALSTTKYMLAVTPNGPGAVGVSVAAGVAADAAGNANTAGAFTITFAPPGAPLLVGFPQFAAASDAGGGAVTFFNQDRTVRYSLSPFPGFTGGIRTASADFNRDGVADVVVGTGPGRVTGVRVLDGIMQNELFSVQPFEASFTGGVYVSAGDVTGDGVPDLAITPDEGGGPRVDVYDGATFKTVVAFFGIDDTNFRGGARSNIADMSGDGVGDLVVVAGFGGGPRVAAFDGTTLTNVRRKLFNDFFAFEVALRNGIFVAAGDINGDGFADLVCGGGPGGGPRVQVYDGKALSTANQQSPIANFFGGDDSSRGGIRVSVKNLDDDNRADIVVGAGSGAGSRVTGYLGSTIAANGTPPVAFAFESFAGFTGGVFVG